MPQPADLDANRRATLRMIFAYGVVLSLILATGWVQSFQVALTIF